MDFNAIWNTIKDFFTNNAWGIAKFLLFLVFGFFVCKILIKLIRKILSKTKLEGITQKFLMSVIRIVIWLIYVMTLLNMLGVDLTGVIAAFAAAAVAIGLALESSLSNLASGIILVTSHIIKQGDYILVSGVEGTVINIGLLETTILTTDNKTIHIPNLSISNSSLINYSTQPTRRVDFTFGVDYATDVNLVKKVVVDVMKSNGKVLLNPEPTCRLKTLNESSIDLFATCWCDSEDYWDVYYYVTDKVFDEFKKNDISIPFKQVEVRLRNDEVVMPTYKEGLPERTEKVRKENFEGDFIDKIILQQQKRLQNKKKSKKQN